MATRTRLPVPLAVIADEAGVSVSAVSKVLHGRSDVAATTRAHIVEVLRRHGVEVSEKKHHERTGVLDLRIENLLGGWSEEVIRGVVTAADHAGLEVIVSVGRQNEDHHTWLTHALRRGTDGFITVVSVPNDRDRARIAQAGLPLVAVDPWTIPHEDCLSVAATNWLGGMDATSHLIELGHRRIATITGAMELKNALARLGGYRSALTEADLAVDEDLIRVSDYTTYGGYQAAQYFLSLDCPPTAIFAASDDCALGAMRAYREAGFRVPDDISIIGFDDLPTAQWSDPALTTVRQPLEQMGMAAIDLISRFHADAPQVRRIELATELVVRGTTAALA